MATSKTITVERSLYKDEVTIIFYPTSHRYKIRDNQTGEERWADMSPSKALQVVNKPGLIYWAVGLASAFLKAALANKGHLTVLDIEEASRQHTIKKEEGRTQGSAAHDYLEAYAAWQMAGAEGDQPALPEFDNKEEETRVQNAIIAALSFFQEEEVRFVASEEPVYHRGLDVPGKLDLIFTCKRTGHKKLHLLDFKTGKPQEIKTNTGGEWRVIGLAPYDEALYQTACYWKAKIEEAQYTLGKKAPAFGDRLVVYLGKETAEFTPFWVDSIDDDFAAFANAVGLARRGAAIKAANETNPPIVV